MPAPENKDKLVTSFNPLIKELIDAGLIPQRCYSWTVSSLVGDVVKVRSECFVTEEEFRKLSTALKANPESFIQDIVVANENDTQEKVDISVLGDEYKRALFKK